MSKVAIDLNLEQLNEVLRDEWISVRKSDPEEFIDDDSLLQRIRKLLEDDRYGVQTFRYMFLSSVLTNAVHPEAHYRAVQTKADLDGAFSSRTVAEQVIVDWEQANGQRLGGSNEPGTSKPFRWAEVSENNQVMRDDAHRLLYELLEEFETQTAAGELDQQALLRCTLSVIAELERQTVDFSAPSQVPYMELKPAVEEYLELTGGGERLAAVAAGVIRAIYEYSDTDEWSVTAEHVNIPDEQSNAAGDIELFKSGSLQRAFEVKDKSVAERDIIHSEEKAQKHEVEEYLYLVGDGFAEGEKTAAKRAVKSASVEMIIVYPHEILSRLKFVGKSGRKDFLNHVGDILDEMRAQERNRRAWEETADQFSEE